MGDNKKELINEVKEKALWNVEGNLNKVWSRIATCVKNIAKEVVGETRSSLSGNKKTWWWDVEIHTVVE